MMMISPLSCQKCLSSLLSENPKLGPHTALLATPQGRLISHASVRASISQEFDDADNEEDEEPWLEEPERQRLLLGLLSQWQEDESPRIECELGRLLVRLIKLPATDAPANASSMPTVRSTPIRKLVLLVNGTSRTSWSDLVAKAEQFQLE